MQRTRTEILPGVWLTALHTDKFKTGCLSVTLLTQLTRERAAMNAVLPFVLRRGSTRLPDLETVAGELDSLYGATITPVVRKLGEIQCVGFYSTFADDRAAGAPILPRLAEDVSGMLLAPNTRGGLLRQDYVRSEKDKLLDKIRGCINDKRSYATQRLTELMCCYEDYCVPRLGDEDMAESIHYQKLTRHYHELLAASPVEVFYCGSLPAAEVAQTLADALAAMPRGEIDYDIGTDIRMNAVEEDVRFFTEEMAVTQGKLAIGYRLGECMEDPDLAALRVFNALFGGCVTSKLFLNVREKLSLCYYASSRLDLMKGLMLVSSGIEVENYDKALAEINVQLDAVRAGDFTDGDLAAAKKCLASDLRAIMDTPAALEGYWLQQNLQGLDFDPMELAALTEAVTREDVVEIAGSVVCDSVYFLKGTEDDDGE